MNQKIKKLISPLLILTVFLLGSSFLQERELNPVTDVAPHVVAFKWLGKDNGRYATGFHLKYGNKTYIVTNKHVCDFNIKIYNHRYIQFDNYVGEIITISKKHDLCLVTSNREEGLELAQREAKAMEEVILVGHPRGIGKTIRNGRVIDEITIHTPWLDNKSTISQRISSTAYRGNSGSPVVNKHGKVVGVLFAGSPAYPTEPFIVPFRFLIEFLENNA